MNETKQIAQFATSSNQTNTHEKPFLHVENLSMFFKVRGNFLRALDDVSFDVAKGDFFGIIGESGSGKSTIGKCLIRLYDSSAGKIAIDDYLVSNKRLSKKSKKWLRKNVAMIFQDPLSSLNPIKNVLQLVSEPLAINKKIYLDTWQKWHENNKIAKYFLNDFRNQNQKRFEAYQQEFLTVYNATIRQALTALKRMQKELLKANQKLPKGQLAKLLHENLLIWFEDLINEITKKAQLTYEFTQQYLTTLENYKTKYEKKDFYEFFVEFEKIKQDKIEQSQIQKYDVAGVPLKTAVRTSKEAYQEIKKQKREFLSKTDGFLKTWESTVKTRIKSRKYNLNTTKDLLLYSVNYLHLMIQKTIAKAVQCTKKFQYLTEEEINQAIAFVLPSVQKLFDPLLKTTLDLANEFDEQKLQDRQETILNMWALRQAAVNIFKNFASNSELTAEKLAYQKQTIISKHNSSFVKELLSNNYQHTQVEQIMAIKNYLQKLGQQNLVNEKFWAKQVLDYKREYLLAKINYHKTLNSYYSHSQKSVYDKNLKAYFKSLGLFKDAKVILKNKLKEMYFGKEAQALKNSSLQHKKTLWQLNKKTFETHWLLKKSVRSYLQHIKVDLMQRPQGWFKNWWDVTALNNNNLFTSYRKEANFRYKSVKTGLLSYQNAKQLAHLYAFIFNQPRYLNWVVLPLLYKILKKQAVFEALEAVGLQKEHAYRYPHEFSGGQRQRIVIARALINNPKMIIADEPISALDVSVQGQIINILQDLATNQKVTVLFIAHDLSMVNYVCNNVIIMHRGKILEKGETKKIFANPIHPYTKSLLQAIPKLSKSELDNLTTYGEELTYDMEYSEYNKPNFHSIANDESHQVFATGAQIAKWTTTV